jgi:hypothetical protein
MKSNIKQFIRECDTCLRVKYENVSLAGLLQPLPILARPWLSISMDFNYRRLAILFKIQCHLGGGRQINKICTFFTFEASIYNRKIGLAIH